MPRVRRDSEFANDNFLVCGETIAAHFVISYLPFRKRMAVHACIDNLFYWDKTMLRTLLLLSALFSTGLAQADSCVPYIAGVFNGFPSDQHGPGHYFNVRASRLTARGYSAYTSHAMSLSYDSNMSTEAKSRLEGFSMTGSGDLRQGQFRDVFPGRADGKTDLTTFKVFRNGTVQLILNSWGNSTINLTNLQCFRGHQGSGFVMLGQDRTAGYGLNLWTFFMSPGWIL